MTETRALERLRDKNINPTQAPACLLIGTKTYTNTMNRISLRNLYEDPSTKTFVVYTDTRLLLMYTGKGYYHPSTKT